MSDRFWLRIFDPRVRSTSLYIFEHQLVGLDDVLAAARRTGKFDYDAPIEGLQVIDRYTLRVRFRNPYFLFQHWLTYIALAAVPREVVLARQDESHRVMDEQFDREHQPDIDRARHERPGDANYLIAQAKGRDAWEWEFYRPFVALALEYDLPIVAANLSRDKAMQVGIDGWPAVFDARMRDELKLDALPADFRRKHEDAIAAGHCNLLRAEDLGSRARAQVARDIVMAQAINTYVDRGVVLLAGNGHVRRDIGVPFWLAADAVREALSIGLLERNDDTSPPEDIADFDAYVITERAARADPCKELAQRLRSPAAAR